MPTLHLLGTGAAVSDPHRTTTMLAFSDGPSSTLVVDCGGDVVQRLLAAAIDLDGITALIVTHEHPDHVSGFPLFMEKIWLAGRRRPIPVYGIAPALRQARAVFEAFDTSGWKGMPEIQWRTVAHEPDALVLEDETWRVTATPGVHPVPVVGLRVVHQATGRAVTYSCDTEPADNIAQLVQESDVLVHEANGEGRGHSSAAQAAEIAAERAAFRLLLVHVPPSLPDEALQEARHRFPNTEVGEELGAYDF